MLHPSTKKLIDRLSEMTLQRKIEWVNGDQDHTVAYDTEGYRVILENAPCALILCDSLGNALERADETVLSETSHIDGGTYTDRMEAMFTEALRIARGTEQAIATVLNGLDLDGDRIPDIPDPVTLEEPMDDLAENMSETLENAIDETQVALIPETIDNALSETDAMPFMSDQDTISAPDSSTDVRKAVAELADGASTAKAAAALPETPNQANPQPFLTTGSGPLGTLSGLKRDDQIKDTVKSPEKFEATPEYPKTASQPMTSPPDVNQGALQKPRQTYSLSGLASSPAIAQTQKPEPPLTPPSSFETPASEIVQKQVEPVSTASTDTGARPPVYPEEPHPGAQYASPETTAQPTETGKDDAFETETRSDTHEDQGTFVDMASDVTDEHAIIDDVPEAPSPPEETSTNTQTGSEKAAPKRFNPWI